MSEDGQVNGAINLTPAAQALLRHVLENWRAQIVALAEVQKLSHGSAGSIDTDDLRAAIDQLGFNATFQMLDQANRTRRQGLIARFTLLIGVASVAVVAVYLAFFWARDGLDKIDALAGVASIFAAASALGTATFALYSARRTAMAAEASARLADATVTEAEFLRGWAELERAIRNRVRRHQGESGAIRPLRPVLHDYADIEGLGQSDVQQLLELLQIRNQAAHGVAGEIDAARIRNSWPVLQSHIERASR